MDAVNKAINETIAQVPEADRPGLELIKDKAEFLFGMIPPVITVREDDGDHMWENVITPGKYTTVESNTP